MARKKKPVQRVQMTEGKRNIIHQLLEEYDIQSAQNIQDSIKDLLGGTIKEMMERKWMNTWDMKSLSVQIVMITTTVTSTKW